MHHAHVLIILSYNANTQLLLAYGSPLLRKNTLGKTPCYLASYSSQFVIVIHPSCLSVNVCTYGCKYESVHIIIIQYNA